MKIIGETKDGFIIDCKKDEVYNISGFYSSYAHDAPKLKVGDEINISNIFQKLSQLKNVERENQNAIKSLKFIIDALTMVNPVTTYEESGEKHD